MSARITEAGLVELETGLRKHEVEDGPLEPARVSAKLALQLVDEVRRLRGLIVNAHADVHHATPDAATDALAAEARAIREEQDKGDVR
jgi:hypothetical protein